MCERPVSWFDDECTPISCLPVVFAWPPVFACDLPRDSNNRICGCRQCRDRVQNRKLHVLDDSSLTAITQSIPCRITDRTIILPAAPAPEVVIMEK